MSYKGVGVQASRCAGVPRWYPGFRGAALRGVVAAPCLRTGRYGARSIKGKQFRIRDRREPKLPRGSNLRMKSCLEQIHGASCLPSRPCWDHTQQPWLLRSARGARQRFSRYLSWRVVAGRCIFTLAFGAVSTYTLALVEGENIRERL